MVNCDGCEDELGEWKYHSHGQIFCSFDCMSKVYSYKFLDVIEK